MITILSKKEYDNIHAHQMSAITNSMFVFIIDINSNEYECVKNRADGRSYVGVLDDFNWDLADRMQFLKDNNY